MALAAQNVVEGGDAAFYRVDTRTPPHELAAGVCSDATNKRFEDGRAWPRFGVTQQPWGLCGVNLIAAGWTGQAHNAPSYVEVTGLKPGATYTLFWASAATLSLAQVNAGPVFIPGQIVRARPVGENSFTFVAAVDHYWIWTTSAATTGLVPQVFRKFNSCGYSRFNDPNGFDTTVVLTDDWRDNAGEDGGRGRAWKVQSGNAPVQVPLNGSDIYGTARLIPCFNGLVMLRQDNERHYFQGAAVGVTAANEIQLNCAPDWNDGDIVFLWGDVTQNSAFTVGTNPPALMIQCFVKGAAANNVKLYSDAALTKQYLFTTAMGRFYLERQATSPGPFGNGAWPLLAQPDATGDTLWDVGFLTVPSNIVVASTVAATGVWNVPNHRLIPGDSVVLKGMSGGDTPPNGTYYVYPTNANALQLFDNQVDALAAANGGATGLEAIAITVSVPVLTKTGASGLPMPPAREGYFTDNNQLVLINGANGVYISDPNDPLHNTPLSDQLTANLGESDPVVAVSEIASSNTLIFLKANSILALYNFSGGAAAWQLQAVTREYGCAAPLSVRQWANNLFFLSRRGLDRVEYSAFGVLIGVHKPVSYNMQKYINLIDWNNADLASVETWNNRLFMAYPMKGQPAGSVVNNSVLSLNFLNTVADKEEWGWEGAWNGAALSVYGFARLGVYGDERLTFLNYGGQVCWLDDGWLDLGTTPVADSLTTRSYGKAGGRAIWQQALLTWDTCGALMTVTASSPGWKENYLVTPAGGLAYNRTIYLDGETVIYNPATQVPPFNNPFRADYSLAGPGELIGGQPDVHQNIVEPFRMRIDDWGVQLTIANSNGSCRLGAVNVAGVTGPSVARRRV